MLIIIASSLIISGIFATIAKVNRNTRPSDFIAVYLLGVVTLILTKDFMSDGSGPNQTFTFLMIAVLSINFAIGEFVKNKNLKLFLAIPVLLSGVVFLYPGLAEHSYMGHPIDDINVLFVIALVGTITPILLHLVNAILELFLAKITPFKWTEKDKALLQGGFSFAFIGIMAALGGFLLGKIGVLVAATFFMSSSFIARNRTSISSSILISASGALFLISAAYIILEQAGFNSLDLNNGEVLQGIFMAGFIALFYILLTKLGQNNDGKWKFLMIFKAVFVPILVIFLLGFAYTQLERLGGVLTLTALLISLGAISLLYSTFKIDSNITGLKLLSLGTVLIIAPYFSPIQQSSGIDLGALGIEQADGSESQNKVQSYHDQLNEPNGRDLSIATGKWKIDETASKIFFELGPQGGRTKGEFQKVKGKFSVKEELSDTEISVVMPVANITTFNSMRDESLLEEEYLHEEKHPELSFDSKKFTKKGDAYEVEGEFTLLGITKPIDLTLKLVGVGEKDGKEIMVLWGKASLNRTDYGMVSSAKIGDVVDFHFEVQLVK